MGVHRPILREHLPRPVICLLELWRARQPRPNVVRQIFQIRRSLAVLANLGQNLRIRRSKWTLLLRRFRQSSAHNPQSQHHAAHQHANPTQSHSSTSNSIWILLLIPRRDSQRNRRRPLAWPHSFLKTRASQSSVSRLARYLPRLRKRGASWHFGQKWLLRPATIT